MLKQYYIVHYNKMHVCGREAARYFYAQRPLKIIWNKNIATSIVYNNFSII